MPLPNSFLFFPQNIHHPKSSAISCFLYSLFYHLFIYLSVVCLSSVYYLSVHLPVSPSIHSSIHLSIPKKYFLPRYLKIFLVYFNTSFKVLPFNFQMCDMSGRIQLCFSLIKITNFSNSTLSYLIFNACSTT